MSLPVIVIGLGADGPAGLSPQARSAIAAADFLAGGRRHLELIEETPAERFAVANNLDELVARLRRRGDEERCVVLASGDPLFFGIGHRLGQELGRDQIIVLPALSSLQLAFARAGLAWHDAAIASVHGRSLAETLRPLLGRSKIGLFSQDGQSPAAIAAFFQEHGLEDYRAWVGEDLGSEREVVTACRLPELVGRAFSPLNVVILLRDAPEARREREVDHDQPPGIPDEQFHRTAGEPLLLTHADVRVIALSRFRELPEGPLWDIGAGLGGVAVELARAFPAREVVAIERSPEHCDALG
ncbi:MAG: precorrin-6y C5,15-methyltransferase (decarboxylating) subunit CbiE, partial [Isosphaeraceae bacterium]|nr:precorrin-6y C5,15-methyltransferase (decarboxylating) subunit CbiE [Isosphaeraceae bacterium]